MGLTIRSSQFRTDEVIYWKYHNLCMCICLCVLRINVGEDIAVPIIGSSYSTDVCLFILLIKAVHVLFFHNLIEDGVKIQDVRQQNI